ncbi:MAG TPA: efflux RND transporter periplasmic adaptor subunit [Bryobacteraceae bacterium]|jgi:HlyD family secretion protein|nr:efflux RND transporter periplasmic adaptor subunit [Bryobacteraceae bacterium]
MKRRRAVLILLLLAAAGGGGWYWFYGGMNRDPNRILVSGNLELTQVDLSFKTAGRMTELAVREGQFVKKGDLIAKLDSAQLEQQLLRDQAAVASAQSSLQQLQTSIEFQGATIDSDISTRRAELAQAQAKLDELMAGSRPQEIQQAQSAVADAKAWNDQAKSDWERAQTLFAREDISRSQYDQAKAKLDSTEAQLRQAQEHLALVREGPRKEEIAGARAQVARAQAAVQTAEANRIELRRKEQELAARRAEIDRTRAQVGMTQTQIADATVVAPIDGVVLVKAAEAGEVMAAGTTIVSLGDLDHPWLRAYIGETDLGRVKLGGKVRLSTDSFPGKTYDGQISFISSEAEFTPKQIQTKEERVKLVYRIKIDVANQAHEMKNNMPVDAEILL